MFIYLDGPIHKSIRDKLVHREHQLDEKQLFFPKVDNNFENKTRDIKKA